MFVKSDNSKTPIPPEPFYVKGFKPHREQERKGNNYHEDMHGDDMPP
jgi:hypothetical protein